MTDRELLILIVDDEPAHAAAVERVLTATPGMRVASAGSLAEYVERVAALPPDLALVDLNLPDGRAVELLTFPPESGGFPVVVMTSHGNEQTAVEAMRAGAIDYVVKSPGAFADMPHTVERALREWKLRNDHQRAEQALRESEERHRTLFQSSHDALLTFAPPSWRFSSGNPAALGLFGARDEAEFLACGPWDYSPELQPDGSNSRARSVELLEAAMLTGALAFEWVHQRRSGEQFPATVLLTRLELHGQALLQATIRDETEKRRLQASVAQADRLASMGMLAAGVAHEINNPLTYVLSNVDSLLQDLPGIKRGVERLCADLQGRRGDGAVVEVAGQDASLLQSPVLTDVIDRASDALEGALRIRDIARDLGAFSRVDRTERTRVDLIKPLLAAINMAKLELRHRARLVTDLGASPTVWATEGRLAQVFLNLLVNAAHAIDEGNVRDNQVGVRIWTEGSEACVAIADTGRGIPAEDLQRVFEPFFTTKPPGAGTGLGLAICRSFVEEFGGNLDVTSQIGSGTTFVLRLPMAQELEHEQVTTAIAELPPTAKLRGRILVVDDEVGIRTAVARILGREHDVHAAASGEEAQAMIEQDPAYDLLLCDLTMPQVSGVEFHAWLSQRHPRLARQTVFITGGACKPAVAEYLASVENLKLDKPFDANKLRRLIHDGVTAARHELGKLS